LKRSLDACRSHPILLAAILGGVFGLANVVWIEVGGAAHKTSAGVVPLLWSSSTSYASSMNPVQTSTLLLIEVAGNVLAFTLLFTLPIALLVGIRRIVFGSKPANDPQADPANSPKNQ